MWNPDRSYVDDINDFLSKHDAKLFGHDTWRLLIKKVRDGVDLVPTMILAPTDKAVADLMKASNRTWQEIYQSREGTDILQNHISITETQKHWPMFTAINRKHYGSNQADIEALQPVASTVIRVSNFVNIVIIVINKVILHDDQLLRLKNSTVPYSIWQRQNPSEIQQPAESTKLNGTEIAKLGKDVFRLLVTEQKIAGRDLLALCSTDKAIATLCDRDDQSLFKQLLRSEFNFDYSQSFTTDAPRTLYAKFHHFRLDVYVKNSADTLHQRGQVSCVYSVVKNDLQGVTPIIVEDIKITHSRIAVPLEGWFANNFDKPLDFKLDQTSLYSNPNSRKAVYLIYVQGLPETATLVFRKGADYPDNRINFELSNDWFSKYFNNRPFAVEDRRFTNVSNPHALVTVFLKYHVNDYSVLVQTFDANHIVVFVRLHSNEVV